MTYAPRSSKYVALRRLVRLLDPVGLAERWAAALLARPLPVLSLSVLLPAMGFVSAKGLAGASGWPLAVMLPLGLGLIAFQVGKFVTFHHANGMARLGAMLLFLVVTCWNMISLTAGLVASRPNEMGRSLTLRALDPVLASTQATADRAGSAAARLNDLARYSAAQAQRETAARDDGYAPTCPASTGPGDGPVRQWRQGAADETTTLAEGLSGAASESRIAASNARNVAQGYTLERHDAAMSDLSREVEASAVAARKVNVSAVVAMLDRLDAATAPGGVCPDATARSLSTAARSALMGRSSSEEAPPGEETAIPSFVPPPRPSESAAVSDLFGQIEAWASGREHDFSLYRWQPALSLLIDLIMMAMVHSLLPPRRGRSMAERRAASVGAGCDPAFIDEAVAEVAASAEWAAVDSMIERGHLRFGRRTSRITIDADDWETRLRLAGLPQRWMLPPVHGENTLTFILRPGAREGWFREHVRDWFRRQSSTSDFVGPREAAEATP